jgi:DNA-directed RNA polymerase specialized sigma subunit
MSPHETSFADYQTDPTPETLSAVVRTLRPTIDYALGSLQSQDDPVMRVKAHALAARAIQRFDPANGGASLPTWVSSQLLPLRRTRRQMQTAVRVPERIHLDAYTLAKAEKDFVDKHNREPDVSELADFSKLPIKRIHTVRGAVRRTPSETAIGDGAPPIETDFTGEAVDYVHQASDHVDRRILELKTGYGGAEMMQPKDIAVKLKLSPTQLTRRSQRLTYRIQEIEKRLKA